MTEIESNFVHEIQVPIQSSSVMVTFSSPVGALMASYEENEEKSS